MDRLVYLSMSGAKALMERQDAVANNLANASTPGFRAAFLNRLRRQKGLPERAAYYAGKALSFEMNDASRDAMLGLAE